MTLKIRPEVRARVNCVGEAAGRWVSPEAENHGSIRGQVVYFGGHPRGTEKVEQKGDRAVEGG